MTDPTRCIVEYQRGFFARLEEFFQRATGKSAAEFATVETFGDAVRSNAHDLASRCEAAFIWLDSEVRAFQACGGLNVFMNAKQLGGMRLVLGGSSRFLGSQLNSVSTAVLYCDTVLIPDPIMPWLERDRGEEKFRHVLLLQAVHALLQLKPLVDADLHGPPVVVFPSWEKSLEDRDAQTQEGISQLIANVLSDFVGEPLANLEDARKFADRYPDRFCEAVDRDHLLVAPGGPIDEPLGRALARYEREMGTWRSREWIDAYKELPIHRRVLLGISERVSPLYHHLENAEELRGHPLMCLDQHAHYFRLVSHASSARLEKLGLLDPKTTALVRAMGARRLHWLGRIPFDTLAKLRLDNENASFRERLGAAVGRLHDAVLGDVDRVAAEVCHEIESAMAVHEKELRLVQEKYNRIHGQTAVLAVAAAGAALIPALAPFLGGAAPVALAAKYGYDKIEELAEKRALTQSLVGVLAAAKSEG